MGSRAPALLPPALARLLLLAFLFLSTACIDLGGFALMRQPLVETVVFGDGSDKLLLVDVQGAITDYEDPGVLGTGTEGTVARVREQLQRAEDIGVKGLLLRVDSPGGTASASEVVYRQLRAFKERMGVPVVAQFMGTAASGGYYVAMAADEIQAYPTTITGSIGVIGFGLNFSGLMEKIGVENQTFTSADFKDTGSPVRAMRDDERAHMQSIVDALHARFREVVGEGRPGLSAEQVDALADGRVHAGQAALELGLVDRIAPIEDAIERLEELAGIADSRVVTFHRTGEWRNNLFTRAPAAPVVQLELDLRQLFGPLPRPGFHYLWLPRLD